MEQLAGGYCTTYEWDEAMFDLSLGKINRQQRAIEIRENLCETVLNCTAINILNTKDIPSWKDCHRNDTNSMHQQWCAMCSDLPECLKKTSGQNNFLQFIVNTFYTYRIYHNKRNIIDSSISTYLYHYNQVAGEAVYDISNEVPKYLKTFNLLPEHNLTLLDAWAYENLEVIKDSDMMIGGGTKQITALRNCINNQNEESCSFVQKFWCQNKFISN